MNKPGTGSQRAPENPAGPRCASPRARHSAYVTDRRGPEPDLGDGAHSRRAAAQEAEGEAQQRAPGGKTAAGREPDTVGADGSHLYAEAAPGAPPHREPAPGAGPPREAGSGPGSMDRTWRRGSGLAGAESSSGGQSTKSRGGGAGAGEIRAWSVRRSRCCGLTLVSGRELKSCFKLLQTKAMQDQNQILR
uniref:Uncharacterized protein n=1 Tax=Rangifer tarandus platyrhynchus TaxID=3082113 RepID=A0ACB0EZ09_RANTA|nr:unnamed protein product [Rangifer tarandus platyrhynchus]